MRATAFLADEQTRARRRRCVFRQMLRSLIHSLEQIFEGVEAVFPEARHLLGPLDQRRQRSELYAIARLAAFVSIANQTGFLQHRKMLRDRRLRNSGPRRQRTDGLLPVSTQSLKERSPRRVGKRFEENIVDSRHSFSHNRLVMGLYITSE